MQQVDLLEEGGGGWEGEEEDANQPLTPLPVGQKIWEFYTSMYWKSVQSQVPL